MKFIHLAKIKDPFHYSIYTIAKSFPFESKPKQYAQSLWQTAIELMKT